MPTISLCMITYNNENNIQRCLESVCGFVDEIIVADTGSEDCTKEIAAKFTDKIFDFEWTEDFSKARNYSISKASCDWILLMDADEELIVRDSMGLRLYLQNTEYNLLPICMAHFYGGIPADEKHAHFSVSLRLFRNDGSTRVGGVIHERIDADCKSIGQAADIRYFIRILHYGYMDDAPGDKRNRNTQMLLKEKEKQPDDPWLCYYLAAEYYRTRKLQEAYREVNEAIILFLGKRIKPPAIAYKLKYDMLVRSPDYETAYGGIEKAIALYPDYVDLHLYKGLLQYKQEKYAKARDTFYYCLVLGETNMEYLILSGSGSFLPLYYIALCHEAQGQSEQANEAFRQAEALCAGIGSVGVQFENPDEAFSEQRNPPDGRL